MPAPVERRTSATDWSRWRSTKWWCQSSGVAGLAGDQPQLAGRAGRLRLADDGRLRRRTAKPGGDGGRGAGRDALGQAVRRGRSCRGRSRRSAGSGPRCSGTKAARSSSQRSLPWRWECRCTSGLQPPETASRSQAISSMPEVSSPSSLMLRTVTPVSRPSAGLGGGVGHGAADQHPGAGFDGGGGHRGELRGGRPRRRRP